MHQNREYLIFNYSPFSLWIFLIIGLVFPVIFGINLKLDLVYNFLILFSFIILGRYLSRYGLQPIRVILTDTKIRLEYLSQDLQKIKKLNETDLTNITEFSDYSITTSQKITFYFKNKMTFVLCKHGNFHRSDDFEKLSSDLKNDSIKSSNFIGHKETKVPKYWDYLKTKDAKLWYYISIVSILCIVIISILIKNYVVLAFIGFPIGFMIKYKINK